MKEHPCVVMLLSNPFRPDPRVAKEALTLGDNGYMVSIICWDRMAEMAPYEKFSDRVEIIRVQNVRSSYGVGIKQITRLPFFWREAIRKIAQIKPEFVHCHDLDTLYIGWQIKRLTRCKLIYDAHEDYPELFALYIPSLMVKALSKWELFLLRNIDYMITVSSLIVKKYSEFTNCPVETVRNFQSIDSFNSFTPDEIAAARLSLGWKPEDYLVAYIGGFSLNRMLLPLIEAVTNLQEVKLVLWGDGIQKAVVQEAVRNTPNASYMGWAASNNIPLFTSLADVIYYCLQPDYPYSTPNTLSNAMLAGRPILASRVGDLGRIVEETGCGIVLDEVTPDTIRKALDKLRDPVLRQKLGQAGRKAAENRYNWDNEAHKLLAVYKSLE